MEKTTTNNEDRKGSDQPTKKPKQTNVRVGVGVLVKDASRPNAVFAGIRKGSHGAGSLALPGGHLEMFETWQECAIREVKEETNLDLKDVTYAHVTNDMMESEGKHYVTIFMVATTTSQEEGGGSTVPRNMEPDKCEEWKSFTWQELKDIHAKGKPGLFGPLVRLIEDEPESVINFLSA